MKLTKITFSLLFLIGFNCLKAQTALYTLDCEKFASGSVASTTNNINYDRGQCWALGSFTYVNASSLRINGVSKLYNSLKLLKTRKINWE